MTTPNIVSGPGTPYITPEVLRNAQTGIAWGTIPFKGATPAQQLAEQLNICWRATGDADGICKQVIRATLNTEEWQGPGSTRVNIDRNTGNGVVTVERWPVLQVTDVQTGWANSWPQVWTPVPSGYYRPRQLPASVYGTSAPSNAGEGSSQILIAPGYILPGRGQQNVQVTYINGWPHAGLTASAAPATGDETQTIQVDDCTGWAPVTNGGQGACGTIEDGAWQEIITCTAASAVTGPGTLTLASPLAYPHLAGAIVTTLPPQVQEAVILLAVAQALERGATATTHMQMPGTMVTSGISGQADAERRAAMKLQPFARVI